MSKQNPKIVEKSLLLKLTGDAPLFKVVDFLLEHKGLDFSKAEIAKGSGLSRTSVFNHWSDIEENMIVRPTRSFGNTTLYALDSKSPIVQKLIELEKVLIAKAMSRASTKRLVVRRPNTYF